MQQCARSLAHSLPHFIPHNAEGLRHISSCHVNRAWVWDNVICPVGRTKFLLRSALLNQLWVYLSKLELVVDTVSFQIFLPPRVSRISTLSHMSYLCEGNTWERGYIETTEVYHNTHNGQVPCVVLLLRRLHTSDGTHSNTGDKASETTSLENLHRVRCGKVFRERLGATTHSSSTTSLTIVHLLPLLPLRWTSTSYSTPWSMKLLRRSSRWTCMF